EPGLVEARRTLRAGDRCLNQDGLLPAMLLVELMAQAGGLLLQAVASGGGGVLAGGRRPHPHRAARGGQTVTRRCTPRRRLGDVFLVEGAVSCGERRLAHGEVLLRRFGPAPKP